MRLDAEIGLKAVEHLLGVFTAAWLRLERETSRCEVCGSYQVVAGVCGACEWGDPSYAPDVPERSAHDRVRRQVEPCTPSSDISMFVGPDDI